MQVIRKDRWDSVCDVSSIYLSIPTEPCRFNAFFCVGDVEVFCHGTCPQFPQEQTKSGKEKLTIVEKHHRPLTAPRWIEYTHGKWSPARMIPTNYMASISGGIGQEAMHTILHAKL